MASVKRGQLTVVLNREAGTLVSLGPEQVEAGLREIVRTMIDAIRSVATFPPLNLSLNQNGSTESHRTRMAMIANNDYEDMFGIIPARSRSCVFSSVSTATSHRLKGEPNGFHLIDGNQRHLTIRDWAWTGSVYAERRAWGFEADPVTRDWRLL